MRTLVLENDFLRVSVLLDKGSDIFEVLHKDSNIDLMWHSPKGYRNPAQTPQSISTADGAFYDSYGGGWNDVFPNYGFASSARNGAQYGLHGESSILPWDCQLSNDFVGGLLALDCVRYPLEARKTIEISDDQSEFKISEELTNVGEENVKFSWAQHIAFGEPFVSGDLEIEIQGIKGITHDYDMPHARVIRNKEFDWPFAPGLDGKPVDLRKIPRRSERVQEDLAIRKLKERKYSLYNSAYDLGATIEWNEAFPFLWYWLNWGTLGYPWYGRARTLALEPCSSIEGGGLADQIGAGDVISLEPLGSMKAEIKMSIFQKQGDQNKM